MGWPLIRPRPRHFSGSFQSTLAFHAWKAKTVCKHNEVKDINYLNHLLLRWECSNSGIREQHHNEAYCSSFILRSLQKKASACIVAEGSINVLCSASRELQCSGQAITHTIKHNEGLDGAKALATTKNNVWSCDDGVIFLSSDLSTSDRTRQTQKMLVSWTDRQVARKIHHSRSANLTDSESGSFL